MPYIAALLVVVTILACAYGIVDRLDQSATPVAFKPTRAQLHRECVGTARVWALDEALAAQAPTLRAFNRIIADRERFALRAMSC